jgi:tRNA A22 N-methylase
MKSVIVHCLAVMVSARTYGAFIDRSLSELCHRQRSILGIQRLSVIRGRCSVQLCQVSSTVGRCLPDNDPRERASYAFAILANKDKSWQRFRHMVDLAMNSPATVRSITDVGTDHGLLAVSLALSGRFDRVLGVDVSPDALKNGAFQVLDKVQEMLVRNDTGRCFQATKDQSLSLDFRLSDGLEQIQPSEADAICIAGMGVNVMTKILQASTNNVRNVDRVRCQYLVVQPTNSRPRNLLQLYDTLKQSGWTLREERLEYLSTRWYLSTSFARTGRVTSDTTGTSCFPTSRLALLHENDPMKEETRAYWKHHLSWIEKEEKASGGKITHYDKRWREWLLDTIDKNDIYGV